MNILLATYSYYPYNFGGTEVYVSGLAKFLQSKGHAVTIIAGVPEQAFVDHPVLYNDHHLKTVAYKVDGIDVVGVIMKNTTTTEIYNKYRIKAVSSWINIIHQLPQQHWDILHLHAHTFAIGRNIQEAVKQYSPSVKIVFSYHLPVSCGKNTLSYGSQLKDCTVKPEANICTACFLADRKNIPLPIGKSLLKILPILKNEKLPFLFRMKFLFQESIHAFQQLDFLVDRWQVFSQQILHTLVINGIDKEKIFQLNHGVDEVFLNSDDKFGLAKRNNKTYNFLYVGRFEKIKGFHTLLKSWTGLEESTERQLEIIGDMQTEEAALKLLIEISKNRKDIIWHGKKTQTEIATIMNGVHCTIIPSEWVEIGPLVFHESISKGCDVICSDIGGCKSLKVLYNTKSTLFKAGNERSLQKAIIEFRYSGLQLPVQHQIDNYRSVEHQYSAMIPVYSNSNLSEC